MTSEAGFRVTVKHQSGALLTLGGDTYEEFAGNVQAAVGTDSDAFLEAYANTFRGLLVATAAPQTVEQAAAIVRAQIPARVVDPPSVFEGSGRSEVVNQPGRMPDPQPQSDRYCKHGQRTRRTGESARGPWVAWFCPTAKGTPDQCKAVFE